MAARTNYRPRDVLKPYSAWSWALRGIRPRGRL